METRGGRLSVTELRRLGATARRRGHPIYENPYLGDSADAWRDGWEGVPLAADEARSRFTSFGAELYDYLVRHDRDDGLTQREITDGLVERGLVKVGQRVEPPTQERSRPTVATEDRGAAPHAAAVPSGSQTAGG